MIYRASVWICVVLGNSSSLVVTSMLCSGCVCVCLFVCICGYVFVCVCFVANSSNSIACLKCVCECVHVFCIQQQQQHGLFRMCVCVCMFVCVCVCVCVWFCPCSQQQSVTSTACSKSFMTSARTSCLQRPGSLFFSNSMFSWSMWVHGHSVASTSCGSYCDQSLWWADTNVSLVGHF